MLVTGLILLIAAIGMGVAVWRKGRDQFVAGLKISGQTFITLMPLLIVAFFMAGLLEVVIPRSFVETYLSEQATWKGIVIGGITGAAVPGGPYVAFPIFGSFSRAGAGVGTIVAFITSWSVWGINNVTFELAIVGPRFSLLRMTLAAVFPFLSGFLAYLFFGTY